MSQQWKIIVIGSPSQQLAWYGWTTEAKVNPFRATAAKPQISMGTSWLYRGTGVLEVTSLSTLAELFQVRFHTLDAHSVLQPGGCSEWKQRDRTTAVGISETYSSLCFHAKENPLAVCTPLRANNSMRLKDSNSRDPSAMELPDARGGIFSFPQTVPSPPLLAIAELGQAM